MDNSSNTHEEFIGLQQVDRIDDATMSITFTNKDVLHRMNLRLTGARGQCYGEGSILSGAKTSVATNIKSDEPRALFTQCYDHSLNLTASDTMITSRIMKDALVTTHEITKLIKYSPKHDGKSEQIRKSEGQLRCGIRFLCPTRLSIRADAMTSIISNYSVFHELWDWSLDTSSHINEGSNSWNTSTHAAIRILFWLGVGSQSAPAY